MYKKHGYCENYLSIDAAKGHCLAKNCAVAFDAAAGGEYAAAPHCFCCCRYRDSGNSLGECVAMVNKHGVYPALRARNCAEYRNSGERE